MKDCNSTNSYQGVYAENSKDFEIYSFNSTKDVWAGISVNASTTFNITSCNAYNTTYNNGLMTYNCDTFTVNEVTIANPRWNGYTAFNSSNYVLQDSSINGSIMQGFWGGLQRKKCNYC